jgi:hypothetical protein
MHRTLVHLALLVGVSFAPDAHSLTPRTREDVKAELAQATRSGDIAAPGDTGLTLRELHPRRYGARPVSARPRAEVVSEVQQARRDGALVPAGEGTVPQSLHAAANLQDATASATTRAEVRAQFRAARRDGDLVAIGETGLTERELHPRRHADPAPHMAAGTLSHDPGAVPMPQ